MNAVVIGVILMLGLTLARVNVIVAMTLSALVAGLTAGLSLNDTLNAFNAGLSGGAEIALSYAMLGAFAVAISKSGLTRILAAKLLAKVNNNSSNSETNLSYFILLIILVCAISSQNLVPVHIAFIPILIPPLLVIFNKLRLDRRAIACILTFGLATSYMVLPYGFGGIYLYSILHKNLVENGLEIINTQVPMAMIIPACGMLVGLIVAVFISYRKHRDYQHDEHQEHATNVVVEQPKKVLLVGITAVLASLAAQNVSGSMILGGLVGVMIFSLFGVVKWEQNSDVFSKGVAMMAMIGFIMISAQGFASVMKATGDVTSLVQSAALIIDGNKPLAAALILLVGLMITMGIGSSFSTVPIIATLFVPLCLELNFSMMATAALVGTAGALGDAGSPASDSTLGPTSGLNADGQHDHIWDSVVPTFIHFNIPLLIFGWIAAMVL
ncbi:Na+/H+ antiporter family protein [Pseudoalteromonas sp. SR44-5]|jgi:predicted histidine transporter YuiF (NhaC family)|uniref:Na+/H+ antiporter family protein n=2 Tax=Pseudoalteromonas TaxID=53246 RepID=A0ABY3FJF0_9GAMM|nr:MULTISPECIES: Na+/H+ antiporter family protein [Pseudoalteromonas]MBB1311300.1 Na+/H+ antiporter family protein [Pseudoalteromonas sp. SR41-8]MBB1367755.1 Na+/H+ antiporter family protein [Pseudoalteromonas sp. SR44-5]MBB1407545.1 Na+/H+ antiporter family protein [Pseudoalteromonas sp. SG44-17]MBB1469349.1 Na+/H+ antiporter family protein [Pseudoalteromonas sp. SG41-5]MBB1481696.1 Na+/H+ antiporter family protein [Pseudoalteromonas sp. SG41-2]